MKFLSFDVSGRASYGLLRGEEIVDLGKRLGDRAPTLMALLASTSGLAWNRSAAKAVGW